MKFSTINYEANYITLWNVHYSIFVCFENQGTRKGLVGFANLRPFAYCCCEGIQNSSIWRIDINLCIHGFDNETDQKLSTLVLLDKLHPVYLSLDFSHQSNLCRFLLLSGIGNSLLWLLFNAVWNLSVEVNALPCFASVWVTRLYSHTS